MRLLRLLLAITVVSIASLVLLGSLLSTARAAGATLFVRPHSTGDCSQAAPCALPTAFASASDGDTIYAASGTYTNTSFAVIAPSKSITLLGGWDGTLALPVVRDPAAYPSVLDGQSQMRAAYISAITFTLDGFVVTRGSATEAAGVAIYAGASVTLRHNVVVSNTATGGWGGGIAVENSRALIEHNVIVSNVTPYEGGGIASAFGSRLIVKNNLIARNSAGVSGAGVRLRDVAATLINNTIAHNLGSGADGVYATSRFTTTLTAVTLTNNIIVSGSYGLRIEIEPPSSITPTVVLSYNDVWSNTVANYAGLADPTGSSGNISVDPRFVGGVFGNYYLSQIAAGQAAGSPAVNAGSAAASALGLDSLTTRTDGTGDGGVVDLGYHFPVPRKVFLPVIIKSSGP